MTSGKIYVNPPTAAPLKAERAGRLDAIGYPVEWNDLGRLLTEEEVIERAGDAVALVAGAEPITRQVLGAAPNLKIVAKFGVGYDNIDVDAARDAGVAVALATGGNTESVADYTFAMILSLCCDLQRNDQVVKSGQWTRAAYPGLWGRTLGIVGFGPIGAAVGRRAAGFGLRVLACDPLFDPAAPPPHADEIVPLEELLSRSDVVSLHVPLTGNRALIDEQAIARMKPGAVLVNAARGGLVDETALLEALRQGRLRGAGLDVFEREPTPRAREFAALNVVTAPHIAGSSEVALVNSLDICAEAIEAAFFGRPARARFVVELPRP